MTVSVICMPFSILPSLVLRPEREREEKEPAAGSHCLCMHLNRGGIPLACTVDHPLMSVHS